MSHTEIIDITKTYPVGGENITAVDNVSLLIDKGDFISIAGHSGSGKTTLISIIGGILSPASGKVIFDGTDICSLNDDKLSEYRNSKIGFIFQFASLLPNLTAKENVLLPCIFSREKELHRDNMAKECLEKVGIGDKINAYPSQLSGGEQRRVAIARAFINSPEMILADEPTGDLDEVTENDIMALFHTVNHEQGTTFVIVTHSSDIANGCRKKYRMSRGILTQET
jgi:putative ABC transport system ATP-binding protein/lipoprotein-releasing system ATP-binding protein